jgi:hypothetical protein
MEDMRRRIELGDLKQEKVDAIEVSPEQFSRVAFSLLC